MLEVILRLSVKIGLRTDYVRFILTPRRFDLGDRYLRRPKQSGRRGVGETVADLEGIFNVN